MRRDTFAWLDVPAEEAARRLLGCDLISKVDGRLVRVRIVEAEAYDQTDEASHAFKGRTNRNDAMFKSAGHMYVYFTYGMHYCCNIVCGPEGFGSGVLVRAAMTMRQSSCAIILLVKRISFFCDFQARLIR